MDSNQSTATRAVHIPEIAGSLQTLFLLRTVLAFGLILAGVACLYFGGNMLTASLGKEAQTILFEIPGSVTVTAGGFGAVVMAASLVPFFLAYRTRPTIELIPTGNSGYRIHVGDSNSTLLARLRNTVGGRTTSSLDAGTSSSASKTDDIGNSSEFRLLPTA